MDQQQTEEFVKSAILKLLGNGSALQKKNLIARLAKVSGLSPLSVQEALAGLAQKKWLSGVYENGIPIGRVVPLVERPTAPHPPSLLAWEKAEQDSGLSVEDQLALSPVHAVTSDFSYDDRCHLIRGLLRLRNEQAQQAGRPTFVVSAFYLLGSAKLLDALPAKALRNFGIDTGKFTGAPPVVLIAGPLDPQNVVMVENPHSFWQAIATSAIKETAFLVTFGYGLSRHGDEYGRQLLELVENDCKLTGAVCGGNPPPPEELLRNKTLCFWGDLDQEGLRIYLRLKRRLPQLELSALYRPMMDLIGVKDKSHPYVTATAKDGQRQTDSVEIVEDGVAFLVAACRERAVDQEVITNEEIERFSRLALAYLPQAPAPAQTGT